MAQRHLQPVQPENPPNDFSVVLDEPPIMGDLSSPTQVRMEWEDRMNQVARGAAGQWYRVMLSADKGAVQYRRNYLAKIYVKLGFTITAQARDGLWGIWVKYVQPD